MNVYLASAFTERWWIRTLQPVLEAQGHTVTNDWQNLTDHDVQNQTAEDLSLWAKRNLEAIMRADCFVLFAHGQSHGGCWTELGYALAIGIKTLVVGESKNLFISAPNVWHCEVERWLEEFDDLVQVQQSHIC